MPKRPIPPNSDATLMRSLTRFQLFNPRPTASLDVPVVGNGSEQPALSAPDSPPITNPPPEGTA